VHQGEIHVPCSGHSGRSRNVSNRRKGRSAFRIPVSGMPPLASHISSGWKEMAKAAAALTGSVDRKSVGISICFYMPGLGVMS